ncbi:MAG: hypothetical protein C4291_05565 [Candidatus Dadabacteria bacterium]
MSANNRFPLSGDVSQVINPWTLWLKSLNQQLGFINVYNVESGDSKIEKRIIESVASYGRQLGWIIEVLDIVLSRIKIENLTEEEKGGLNQFFDLIRRIEEIKQDSRPSGVTLGNVNRMINEIRALKKKDEKVYTEIVSRIKDAF